MYYRVFYGVIILLVIVGTVQDFLARLPADEGVGEGNNKGNKERSQTKGWLTEHTAFGFRIKLLP